MCVRERITHPYTSTKERSTLMKLENNNQEIWKHGQGDHHSLCRIAKYPFTYKQRPHQQRKQKKKKIYHKNEWQWPQGTTPSLRSGIEAFKSHPKRMAYSQGKIFISLFLSFFFFQIHHLIYPIIWLNCRWGKQMK